MLLQPWERIIAGDACLCTAAEAEGGELSSSLWTQRLGAGGVLSFKPRRVMFPMR